MKFLTLIAVAVVAAAPLAAQTTAIIDPGFEGKGSSSGVTNYCYDGFSAGGNAACSVGEWGTAGGIIRSGNADWGGTTIPDGIYYGMLQKSQVLSQTIVATSNSTLALTWLDANRTNNGGLHSYTVTVNGVSLGEFTSQAGFLAKAAPTFTGTSGGVYKIAFNGIYDGTDTASFIDNVQLTVVPEPAIWGLMLTGFGLVGIAARRRSRGATVAA